MGPIDNETTTQNYTPIGILDNNPDLRERGLAFVRSKQNLKTINQATTQVTKTPQ